MARLPKLERGSSGESSDSNLLAIVGVGVAAIVGLLLITGQGPFGGGTESEEPAPITAPGAATTPTDGAGGTTAKGAGKSKGATAKGGKKQGGTEQKQPPKKRKKGGATAPPPGSGGGSPTDQYLDCVAKAQGKKEIDRCAELVQGAGG